ncbi:MAG: histidine kinase dimerization/phospho-acceptor domain-containing protein [Acidimicrobiales bacterium]
MAAERHDEGQDPDRFGIGRLFYVTTEAIVAADLSTETIVLWNPAAERVLGYSAEEAVGMPLVELVPVDRREHHLDGIRRYTAGGDAVLVGKDAVDVTAVTKTGAPRDVSLSITDVSVDDDRRFVLAMLRDVTAERTAEREAAAATAAMREFVATASHDLRSPLAAVLGFAKLLADNGDQLGPERRQTCLDAIERSARQASRLVDDLLTLSHINAGALSTRPEPVAIAAVARQAVADTGVDAAVDVDDAVLVHVDPEHLRRILVNYLVNADRYGAAPVVVRAAASDGDIEVRVDDGGEGVPAGFVDRLFTTFARADESDRRGTGLGLSIVQGLATANGGHAFYDGSAGASFGVVLPASA